MIVRTNGPRINCEMLSNYTQQEYRIQNKLQKSSKILKRYKRYAVNTQNNNTKMRRRKRGRQEDFDMSYNEWSPKKPYDTPKIDNKTPTFGSLVKNKRELSFTMKHKVKSFIRYEQFVLTL